MGARVASSVTRHRSRLWLVLVAAAAAFVGARGVVAWSDWRNTGTSTAKSRTAATALPTRTVQAGAVAVKVQPMLLDSSGATFKVSFDTHSVALDLDVARQARLVVGAAPWPAIGWAGDGPGGHHREGQLRFAPAGPPVGTATLTIAGLPKLVSVSWQSGG